MSTTLSVIFQYCTGFVSTRGYIILNEKKYRKLVHDQRWFTLVASVLLQKPIHTILMLVNGCVDTNVHYINLHKTKFYLFIHLLSSSL
jgi:hypothetical protein